MANIIAMVADAAAACTSAYHTFVLVLSKHTLVEGSRHEGLWGVGRVAQ